MITIQGEAGKAFDESERQFSEVAENGNLRFASLQEDTLTFTIAPEFLDARESEIPEEGQYLTLSIGGERAFYGLVTSAASSWQAESLAVAVTVAGPWWWLEQTALSELIDDDIETPQFRCAKGDAKAHIEKLFARLEFLGVPVSLGTVAECYGIPTVTFRDGAFSYALAELIRHVPDAVGWWDYSGQGVPKFNLSRRSSQSTKEFTLGVDDVISVDLTAEYGLKVEEVNVSFAERLESGETVYRNQSSKSGLSGTRQIVPVSGPELAESVPPDPIDGVTISTTDLNPVSGVFDATDFKLTWKWWQDWIARHPGHSLDSLTLYKWVDNGLAPNTYFDGIVPLAYLDDGTLLDIGSHNKWAVVYDPDFEAPDWLEDVVSVQKGYVRGSFRVFRADDPGSDPDWLVELLNKATYVSTIVGGPDNGDRNLFFEVEEEVTLLELDLTDQSYYKPLSYIYESPPEGYADNLRAAQSWLPYSGDITLLDAVGPLTRHTGDTVNVLRGRKPWETMGALIQGESLDLFTGEHSIDCGLPARQSGSTPVTRLERDPGDNLIIL